MPSIQDIAVRAARWSITHRRRAIAGWLALMVLALGIGGAFGTKQLGITEKGVGESGRAERTLNKAGFASPAYERVLVRGDGLTAADRALRATAADVAARVDRLPQVGQVRPPVASKDGRTLLVEFSIAGHIDDAPDRIEPVLAAVDGVRRAHPGVEVLQAGDASAAKAVDDQILKDFQKAELSAVPLTLVILAIAFGALVAAIVPVALGLSAVAIAIGLIAIPSHVFAVEESISSIVLLIGLAVGVDYAMFYLRREREERAAGRGHEAALIAAARTSGHAVLVSGTIVMASVGGMFIGESPYNRSYALGIIMVVAVAMVGSVTVLPAVLSKLGDRVEKGALPVIGRRSRAAGESRVWGWVLDRVLRRPAVSTAGAVLVLLALAYPVTNMHLAEQGTKSLPQDMQIVKALDAIDAAFPGGALPATVVVSGRDLSGPAGRAALAQLTERVAADDRMGGPATVAVAGAVARVQVPLTGSGTDERSDAALTALREEILPATVERAGFHADVAGPTAMSADYRAETTGRGPWMVGAVLAVMFAILLVSFRSVVVPVKAIVLNLLSVAAAYGVMVLVFQEGWGDSLLGFEATGSISTWVPLFNFLLLFGLSMDYHVFILSRVREGVDNGLPTVEAVRRGVKSTAGVVTSAAVVMIAVFGIFATLSLVEMKQIAIGLAVAVLIDATLVRAVLLPATMALLGEWNWWMPGRSGRRRRAELATAVARS
jgi:RND superfamily putative drug exporter